MMTCANAGLAVVVAAAVLLWTAATSGAGDGAVPVEVRRKGDGWALFRGGRAYHIRGAVYWANPTDRRFPLAGLKRRGGNSVRCGGRHRGRILDEAARLGMTATVNLRMKKEALTGFDYSDADAVAAQLEAIKADVRKYKDHPALLMWGIGNELSMGYRNKAVWDAVNAAAEYIKEVDPHHPTMTVIGGGHKLSESADIRRQCPAIDVLGVNYYGGIETVPARLREVGWDKPYVITEWGPTGHWQRPRTAWGAAIEETSTAKAARYRQRYRAVMLKDRARCLGSYAFIWQWKQERTHTWYGMFLSTGEATEAVGAMQELWTGKPPANRAPRIEPLRLGGRPATANVVLEPGAAVKVGIEADDPDGDAIEVAWEVVREPTKFGYGGMGERRPRPIKGIVSEEGGAVTLRAPDKPGAYRLFAYVTDGQGNAATANTPFHVGPVPEKPGKRGSK